MKFYITEWKHVNGKRGTYKTKSLTPFHDSIHSNRKIISARTMEVDTSTPSPFLLGFIIKQTKRTETN